MAERLSLPGFVNAHSHAFQRALRGATEGDDFWAWRDAMLELAGCADARAGAQRLRPGLPRDARRRLHGRRASSTTSGSPRRMRPSRRRPRPGSNSCCCSPPTGAAGSTASGRSPSPTTCSQLEELRAAGVRVGLAPHSVRACPRDWLEELGRYAAAEALPLHVHADEQPREIEECLAEHGLRPIELLTETGCLGPHTTVVHATHADARELDLLAEAGARVCVCPTTEANLGDGFAPVRGSLRARNRHLHRLGLERTHRPARGAARAGGHRPPPRRQAQRRLGLEPALLRR